MDTAVENDFGTTQFYNGPTSIEGGFLSELLPEKGLWSAVLLLLLKDAERIVKKIFHTKRVMNLKKLTKREKMLVWNQYCKAIYNKRDMACYSRSPDFTFVCDQAGVHQKSMRKILDDVLNDKKKFGGADLNRGCSRTRK